MVIFLQYTVTDLRSFTEHRDSQLGKPQWPSPQPFREFVRGTGSIIERKMKGQSSWVGENFICHITKGIKFDSKIVLNNGLHIRNLSNHMYANENFVLTKYEFVFHTKATSKQGVMDYGTIKGITDALLESKLRVKSATGYEELKTLQLSKKLLNFHYENSTITSIKKEQIGSDHLLSCIPQIYIYLTPNERIRGLESNFTHIATIHDAGELYGSWHNHKNNPIRIWIHDRKLSFTNIGKNRELRMSVMRLHSEYECLKNVFSAISSGRIRVEARSPASNALQQYFNKAIHTYLSDEAIFDSSGNVHKFSNYFSKVFDKAQPGELENLKSRIKSFNFRPNIEIKTAQFITNHIEHMNNKFENNNSTVFSQGDNNTVQNNNAQQNFAVTSADTDFSKLLEELAVVLENAQKEATTTEQRKAVLALSEAEDAAKNKDSKGVISALQVGGKWVADLASKLTAGVLVELIKQNTGVI